MHGEGAYLVESVSDSKRPDDEASNHRPRTVTKEDRQDQFRHWACNGGTVAGPARGQGHWRTM